MPQPPRSWLGRAGLVLLVAALAALAIFFVVIFLLVGAVVAATLLVRWWWFARKLRHAQGGDEIEGEYKIVDDGAVPLDKPRDR